MDRHDAGTDSEARANALQFEYWRTLDSVGKASLLTELCQATYRLQLVGLRLRHPEASAEELELRAACTRIGRAQVERVLGHALPFEE